MSGHAPYLGIPHGAIEELAGDNWCNALQSYTMPDIYAKYRALIEPFDFVVASMPPIWGMMYRDYNKPLILVLPVRYEYGATGNVELWQMWNEFIRARWNAGLLHVVANNQYDADYFHAFLPEIPCDVIPNVCDYTGMSYNPVRPHALYYASWNALESGYFQRKQTTLRAGHSYQQVAEYQQIIHIPYNVSTMSTYEHRAAGIPIAAPSARLLREWRNAGHPVLNQVSWNESCNQLPGSVIQPNTQRDPNAFHNPGVFDSWISACDLYDPLIFGRVRQFDSDEGLDAIAHTSTEELQELSRMTRWVHDDVREVAEDGWAHVLNAVSITTKHGG
jgi:hypothetical protein